MPTLPPPATRFAKRRLPLRQASAHLLAFGVAAVAVGAIVTGAGLEAVNAIPPLSPMEVEQVMAAGLSPGNGARCPCLSLSSPVVARVTGSAPRPEPQHQEPVISGAHRASTDQVDHRPFQLLTTKTRFVDLPAPDMMPSTDQQSIDASPPSDRRADLLDAAIQARSPARTAFVAEPGRQGTASFCPAQNPATCRRVTQPS